MINNLLNDQKKLKDQDQQLNQSVFKLSQEYKDDESKLSILN